MFVASFSFGIKIPPALCHALGMVLFCHAVLMRFQRYLHTSGAFLYTLYRTPFGPGADDVPMDDLLHFFPRWRTDLKLMLWGVNWWNVWRDGHVFIAPWIRVRWSQVLLQVVLCCFEHSTFLLGEESLQELEEIFVEPCSCLFCMPPSFPWILCSTEGC